MRYLFPAIAFVLLLSACSSDGDTNKPPPISSSDMPAPTATPGSGPAPGTTGVQTFPDQGREHVKPGAGVFAYNSSPPSSGPHSAAFLDPGIYADQSPPEALIASMERGSVVVWYNCSSGATPLPADQCRQLFNQLSGVAQAAITAGKRVILTPYADMPHRIALTAWTKLDAFDDFDAARVQAFVSQYERAIDFCGASVPAGC